MDNTRKGVANKMAKFEDYCDMSHKAKLLGGPEALAKHFKSKGRMQGVIATILSELFLVSVIKILQKKFSLDSNSENEYNNNTQ